MYSKKDRIICAYITLLLENINLDNEIELKHVIFTQDEIVARANRLPQYHEDGLNEKRSVLLDIARSDMNRNIWGRGEEEQGRYFIKLKDACMATEYLRLALPNEVSGNRYIANNLLEYLQPLLLLGIEQLSHKEYNLQQIYGILQRYYRFVECISMSQQVAYTDMKLREAVWIGAAVLTYNEYVRTKSTDEKSYYFAQKDIADAAKLYNANYDERSSNLNVCKSCVKGKNPQNYAYFIDVGNKKRRLAFYQEDEKTQPDDCLHLDYIVNTIDGPKTVKQMKEFVENVYTNHVNFSTKQTQERISNDEQNNEQEYVWYGSYGSNINLYRFMLYIRQCTDSTPPLESSAYDFSYPIYYAGKSTNWDNGGTAFLDITKSGHTCGRIYKITKEQYEEIKMLEGHKYSHKVELGEKDGLPIVTFTSKNRIEDETIPSLRYFDTILAGLQQVYPTIDEAILGWKLAETILTERELCVLGTIRDADYGLSAHEISNANNMPVETVIEDIAHLMRKSYEGFIKQDSRTLTEAIDSPDAKFYTISTTRNLIARIRELHHRYQEIATESITAETQIVEVSEGRAEGQKVMYDTTRYERDPYNRARAIQHHGTVCAVCEFDFGEKYGALGEGYIEVHHVKPLHSLDEAVIVNPETDLVCVCANCHRMIHRDRNHVLTVAELKAMIEG